MQVILHLLHRLYDKVKKEKKIPNQKRGLDISCVCSNRFRSGERINVLWNKRLGGV